MKRINGPPMNGSILRHRWVGVNSAGPWTARRVRTGCCMAIKTPCPRCKHVTHLPDSAGGKLGRCKHCNAIVRVPLAESQRKFCSVCRADISLTKRVKDDQGHYYC